MMPSLLTKPVKGSHSASVTQGSALAGPGQLARTGPLGPAGPPRGCVLRRGAGVTGVGFLSGTFGLLAGRKLEGNEPMLPLRNGLLARAYSRLYGAGLLGCC